MLVSALWKIEHKIHKYSIKYRRCCCSGDLCVIATGFVCYARLLAKRQVDLQAVMPENKLQVSVLYSNSAKLWCWQTGYSLSCSLLYQTLVEIGIYAARKGSGKLYQPSSNVLLQALSGSGWRPFKARLSWSLLDRLPQGSLATHPATPGVA